MKVLWLSPKSVSLNNNSYNGGGWINSLLFNLSEENVEIAVAFLDDGSSCKEQINNVTTYPIKKQKTSPLKKVFHYWVGYKYLINENNVYESQVHDIIKDFNPDLIHVWGVETSLAFMIGRTNIPIIVHIQGLLTPCSNAFFPQGLSRSLIKSSSFIREKVLRNGYDYAYKSIKLRAKIEEERMKMITHAMGRTHWDKELVNLYSPNSIYYHVNETIRESFYFCEKKYHEGDRFIITSTISQTVYKGLDIILKSADLLKRLTSIDFEWRVVGVYADSSFVKLFEKLTSINSHAVNVQYLGVLDEKSLSSNLLETSVYVHPSYIDNSPNSLCEAQLIGLTTIACNVGGVSSLIKHEDTGYLVPSNAPHELTYFLRMLAKDLQKMAKIGKQSRHKALKRHNKVAIIHSLMTAYKDASSKNKDI